MKINWSLDIIGFRNKNKVRKVEWFKGLTTRDEIKCCLGDKRSNNRPILLVEPNVNSIRPGAFKGPVSKLHP